MSVTSVAPPAVSRLRALLRVTTPLLVAAVLICLAALNIAGRRSWLEMEDGVLWVPNGEYVIAAEVAPGTPAEAAGVRPGDVLLAIDDHVVRTTQDVVTQLEASSAGDTLRYRVLRQGVQTEYPEIAVAPIPSGAGAFYYALAAVGIFSLVVGATGLILIVLAHQSVRHPWN